MNSKITEWALYLFGLGSWIISFILNILDQLQVDRLQKIFLLLSIYLLLLAIIRFKKGQKFGSLEKSQSAAKTVSLAHDPNEKAKFVFSMINKSKGGFKKMFETIYLVVKKMTKKQWVSLFLFLVVLGLGIASQIYSGIPALDFVANNLVEFLAGLGFITLPGIFSSGKELGESFVAIRDAKKKIKELLTKKASTQSNIDALEVEYADVIKIKKRVDSTGGGLTADQSIIYDTYLGAKKALTSQLDAINQDIKNQEDVIERNSKNAIETIKEELDND